MEQVTACDDIDVVPPPRRQGRARTLGIHAVQLVTMLGLLPLAASIIGLALLCRPRLPSGRHRRGHPIVYSDASIVVIALIARLWNLSGREVYEWLTTWSALARACGLPQGRVIHHAHLNRRLRRLGAFPFWLLYLALVWRAIRSGLLRGRDVVIDSTLLSAWTGRDPDAAWSYPAKAKGHVLGYKVHTLLDRAGRLPLFFLVSPANANDLPFAYPLLWFARFVLALPIHVVRADGAYWGAALLRFIVTVIKAHPIIPFNRKKQPLERVRHLAYWPLSYGARAIIERFFAAAKRYYHLDTGYAIGGEAVLLRVTLTFCAILVVALAAHQSGAPELRLSPTRVLAYYLPILHGLEDRL
jgi:hypothetical protein